MRNLKKNCDEKVWRLYFLFSFCFFPRVTQSRTNSAFCSRNCILFLAQIPGRSDHGRGQERHDRGGGFPRSQGRSRSSQRVSRFRPPPPGRRPSGGKPFRPATASRNRFPFRRRGFAFQVPVVTSLQGEDGLLFF